MNKQLEKMCEKHGVSPDVADAFLDSLRQHIAYVQEAGKRLGVPDEQLLVHDESKFSCWEFPFYAKHFHGGGDPEGFSRAWLHHENHNPHHWGYWIPRSGAFVGQPLEMPERYVREMIADWMGAGRTYTGSWDISGWLAKNGPGLTLHESTTGLIHDILMGEQKYFLTDNCPWSFMRGQ